jgi:hypothetical protein
MLTQLDELWLASNWVNNTLQTNTYDVNGSVTSELSQNWDIPSTTWVNDIRSDYSYNPNGTINQITSQLWTKGPDIWTNSDRVTFTYSQSTGSLELKNEEYVILYPNPAHDMVTIEGKDSITGATYSLEDQAGKQIQTGRLSDKTTSLDISRLAVGIYILRLGDKGQHTYKIIKN